MSSSYLGHGAKYWADRYFEQHTQTRLPDDPADLSWREKYLALEKECEHYQATLSEMRVEIEYLRSQQPTSIVADPDLQRKAEKWKLGYTRLAAALKEKEKQYDALSAEKQRLERHLQERELYRGKTAEQWAELYFSEQRNYQKATSDLQESDSEIQTLNSAIANYHKFNEVDGHDATYWHHRYATSQKEAFKANVFSALVIFFIAFSFGAVFGNHVGGSENLSPSFQTASSSISLSPQVQPQTSIVYSSSNESNTIPLTVTASKNNSYYFCLCQGSKIVKSYYVRAGETLTTVVPPGGYSIYFAYGSSTSTWFGTQNLWGTHTSFYHFTITFPFREPCGQVFNFSVSNSFSVESISKDEWSALN